MALCATLARGMVAWPWLLIGHLALGLCVLAFALLEPPGGKERYHPYGRSPPRMLSILTDLDVEGVEILLLVFSLEGPAAAGRTGSRGVRHVTG